MALKAERFVLGNCPFHSLSLMSSWVQLTVKRTAPQDKPFSVQGHQNFPKRRGFFDPLIIKSSTWYLVSPLRFYDYILVGPTIGLYNIVTISSVKIQIQSSANLDLIY